MAGIIIFGGTIEGRLLAEAFQNTDLDVHICVATEYGAALLPVCRNIHVHIGRMDVEQMEAFFREISAEYCLDATHPYASAVTENIYNACRGTRLPYIRVLRKEGKFETDRNKGDVQVVYKESIEDAAAFLNNTTGNILITTGSRDLEQYTQITDYKNRCFARVLPTVQVVEKCRGLGFEGRNLIGMQGPFSEELNFWMMKQIEASWLVTKNSGKEGGYQDKCEAALRAGVSILVIGRRAENVESAMDLHVAIQFVRSRFLNESLLQERTLEESVLEENLDKPDKKRKVYLIGMGPGNLNLLTRQAVECLEKCDVIIGAKRVVDICKGYVEKPLFQSYKREEIAAYIKEHSEYRKIAIVYSGDIGFYSGARNMKEYLKEYKIQTISGISSPVYFLNKLGIPWDNTKLISCHGQVLNLIPVIKNNKRVCVLLGKRDAVIKQCRKLVDFNMNHIKVTIGERLSYPEERVITGFPSELLCEEVDPLSLVLFENPSPDTKVIGPGIEDSAFSRGKVPMTKQETRVLSLVKLKLTQDSILYDIGAGTGSISIEAALQCKKGYVYAVEKGQEAVSLIEENKRRFQVENLEIVNGEAPDCLDDLPAPTHAFIGGSGGRVLDIIRVIREKNEKVRFVMNAVTLETIAKAEQIKKEFPEYRDMEVIQVNVSRSRELRGYHLMNAENPVYIVCFGG